MNAIRGDAFCNYYISYHYFWIQNFAITGYYYYHSNMHFAVTIYYTIISKNLEIRQKFRNDSIVKKKHKPGSPSCGHHMNKI